MKKILSLALAVIVLATTLSVSAYDFTAIVAEGDYEYIVENGEAIISEYIGSDSEVTIPSTLGGFPVTEIYDSSFGYKSFITKIVIPEGVKRIGKGTFQRCTAVSEIVIPNSIEVIDDAAFVYCSSLTNISFPEKKIEIGGRVCQNSAYYNDKANWENSSLYIGKHYVDTDVNFAGNIDIKEGTLTVSRHAFEYCDYVFQVTIPASVVYIGSTPFDQAKNLTSVIVAEGNEVYYSDSNCIIDKETKTLLYGCVTDAIPEGITAIADAAFYNFKNLTKAVIPEGVKKIGNSAFGGCVAVGTISLPEGLEYIGEGAFSGCRLVKTVDIPESVTTIGEYAFRNCTKLEKAVIKGKVEELHRTFFGCTALTDITLPTGIKSIERAFKDTAFYQDENNYEGDLLYYGEYLLGAKSTIEGKCIIKEGTTLIADDAFLYCAELIEVSLPDSVLFIGDGAFAGCEKMENIVLPDGIKTIEYNCFGGCFALKSITLPKNLELIESDVFASCKSLTSIALPDTLTEIGKGAFSNCISLQKIEIPSKVTTIGADLLKYCETVESVRYYGTKAQWEAVSVETSNEILQEKVMFFGCGDVNGDGDINNLDASLALRYDAAVIDFNENEIGFADVNGDGKVDNLDAVMILKYDAGIIQGFCPVVGHEWVLKSVYVTTHKVRDSIPRCVVHTYDVTYCDHCGKIKEQLLVATTDINCCSSD